MTKKITFLGALLVAIVVTSYSVSGTYAKYVSKIDLADEARVAKWDITGPTSSTNIDLFKSSYEYSSNGIVVKALDDKDVVAPGTSGQYSFQLSGSVETNHKITITATGENKVVLTKTTTTEPTDGSDPVTTTTTDYDPLKFCVKAGNDSDGCTWADFATLKSELGKLYSGEGKVYAPGAVDNTEYTIFWKWDFNGDDAKDTELGKNSSSHSVDLKINITAEQTQDAATVASIPVTSTETPGENA